MKALSVKDMYAYLIFHNGKDVENRTYPTRFRGELWIHASKKSMDLSETLLLMPDRFSYPDAVNVRLRAEALNGCIIGSVRLVGCVRNSVSEWAEKGCWHWVLENPVLLARPIPANGHLGLWEAGRIPPCDNGERR
jgi:hypothetical protein